MKCMFVGPVTADVEEQKRIALDLIKNGSVDGISISVIDEAVATEVIDEAVAAGIPIITFDSDAPQSKREAYVGTDNLAFGEEHISYHCSYYLQYWLLLLIFGPNC